MQPNRSSVHPQQLKASGPIPTSTAKPDVVSSARPKRKRTRVSRPGYVDTTLVIGESSSDEVEVGRGKKLMKQRHRPPQPPPLPRHPDDVAPTGRGDDMPLSEERPSPVSLSFAVPAGHSGPFVVHLNLDRLGLQLPPSPTASAIQPAAPNSNLIESGTTKAKGPRRSPAWGFTSFPPEIRNMIYRRLFTRAGDVVFNRPQNFSRSSQFLRTCKMVAEEGGSILYSENEFTLDRERKSRGHYWQPTWHEVGYADCRVFLHSIGANIAHIRHLTICFQDGPPSYSRSANPRSDNPSGRFVDDEQLLDCLDIISKHCVLHTFIMRFWGRRILTINNSRFIAILKTIRADHIGFCPATPRINLIARDYLTRRMTRREKMFNT